MYKAALVTDTTRLSTPWVFYAVSCLDYIVDCNLSVHVGVPRGTISDETYQLAPISCYLEWKQRGGDCLGLLV